MLVALSLFTCPSEKEALLAIYTATNGKLWVDGQDWFESDEFCSWTGIKCGESEEIIELDLSDFGLQGELPRELACFPHLKSVYLNRNYIPTFPVEICSYSSTLQFLQLSSTGLEALPGCICDMQYLKFLYIDNNQLNSSLPECVFSNMEEFIASCNDFEGKIPQSYSSIKRVFLGCNPNLDCKGAPNNVVCGNEDCTGCALACPPVWDDTVCGKHYLVRK